MKESSTPNSMITPTRIRSMLAPYQRAEMRRSLGMLANSLLPYLALWALMIFSLRVSYWLTLLLAIPAAGFMVRLFIIFHDCGHGSFFKSKDTNRLVGFLLGILVFTPSASWWYAHALHHATSGNLDKRGVGDVTTLTVDEYRAMSFWKRLGYRAFRHPLVMFGLGPIYMFIIRHRLGFPTDRRGERLNVIYNNLALIVLYGGLCWLVGWKETLLIQLPIIWLAGAAGIWLFYLQHQFEGVYWAREGAWDYQKSALLGASYYKLPRLLQWFSGNIGFHHIHHLSPRIPNYFLQMCYQANPELQSPATLTTRGVLKALRLRLWDEQAQKMVGF